MIVVNPDLIVGAQFAGHHFGKAAVYGDIGFKIAVLSAIRSARR